MNSGIKKTIDVVVKFTSMGLKEINSQIDKLNGATRKFTESTNKASTATSNLDKNLKSANKGLKQQAEGQDRASSAARGFASSVGRAISIVAQFTIAMHVVQAVQKTFAFFTIDSARAAIEFQSALASLQAIADVSESDMAKLEKTIFEVAGTTKYTAVEISELQKELSRLGFTAEQVIQSTEAIARFAEAIGADLGGAAQFVGKQLQAFGLSTSSTFELTNSFVGLINNSALSMDTLATSMQYASSIASTLGVDVKETGAILGVLTNNGITASRAGTGLRQIFLELGAQGGTLTDTLEDLAEGNITLGEAQELVGTRAAGALSVLIDQREEIDKLIDAQDTLVASTIASARQNSTFEGQVTALGAAVEKLQIQLGDWITNTEIVLELIELLGGGNTYRGFSVIKDIGLSTEELEAAARGVDELQDSVKLVKDYVNGWKYIADKGTIEKVMGVSAERAAEISELLIQSMKDDSENIGAFMDSLRELNDTMVATETATKFAKDATAIYSGQINDLAEKARKGLKIDKERHKLLGELSDAEDIIKEKLKDRSKLTAQEIKNYEKLLERYRQLQKQLRNTITIKDDDEEEDKTAREEEIKTLEEFAKEVMELQSKIARGYSIGDIVAVDKYTEAFLKLFKTLKDAGKDKAVLGIINNLNLEKARKEGPKIIAENDRAFKEYLKKQEKLDEAFGDLGIFGKVFFGLSAQGDVETRTAFAQKIGEIESLIKDKAGEMIDMGIDLQFEATQRRLDAEQEAVEARYSYEEDRLQALVDNNLITQEEYERKREQLERDRIAKTNEIERKRFEAEKKQAVTEILIDTARAVAQYGFVTPQAIIAGIAGGVQASIVGAQRFEPIKYEDGGIVQGPSHSAGGVPFSVRGIGGYEMEGGEYIVNKSATAKYLPMLEQINSYGKLNTSMFKHFANGGMVGTEGASMGDIMRVNEMLLERLSKPITAFVSERELVSKSNERINQKMKSRL